jgi:hypothetical protein
MKHAVCMIAMLWFAAGMTGGEPQNVVQSYRISGVLVHAVTGSPIPQARISIGPVGQSGSEASTITTGSDGRFAFDGLPAGKWSLRAERKGFVRQAYLQRPEPGSPGVSVVTGPDAPSENLVFRMSPPAVIHGTVTDERGHAVGGAVIHVLTTPLLGYKRALPLKAELTDDHGEYRIWDLPAAPCYLLAVARPAQSSGSQDASSEETPDKKAYEPQWFPHVADPRLATPIALKPGEDVTADFVLNRVRGVSIGVTGGSGFEALALAAEGAAGSEVLVALLAPGQGRTFEGIVPGRYMLQVIVNGDLGPETRAKRIEVGTADVDIHLPLPEPPVVSAIMQVTNADPETARKMGVILLPDAGERIYGMKTGPEGRMTFQGVLPGRHRVVVGGAPELYVKSMAAEGARVANGFLDVPEQGSVSLKIIVGGDGGRVRGWVRADGKAVPGVLIVLAPRDESDNPGNYQGGQTESDGAFDFTGVAPGAYVLFATTNWQLEYRVAAAVRKYLDGGRAVQVEPSSSVHVDLDRLQP